MNQLAAFALVAEEYEKTGDAILGMAPLFDTVIAERAGQPFEPAWFASRFAELFGRAMSPTIAQALCERLEEAKLLERHQLTDGSYVLLCSPKGRVNSSLTENHIQEIAETFVDFSAGLLEKLGHHKSKQSLADDFLQRIAKPEFTSIFLVPERKVRFSRVLSLKGTKHPAREWSLNQAVDYLVADFVLKLSESEGDSFDRLASIAYGALLADAVSALAEPPRANSEDRLRVVIDGPILLDALNLNTESNREYAIGLIDLFKSSGLMLVTFDHVIDEMQRLIERTLESYTRGDAFGPLAARIRSTRGHALYARTVASSLQTHVKDLGVTTLFSDKYLDPPHINFFSTVEEDLLRNALGEVHENLGPRIVDARSIATVIRLKRDNQRSSSALDSGTVFLTRNSALVRRTETYLGRGQSEPRPRFTIMSDGQLASLLWFHNGSSGSHLSKQRLIANCANAALTRLDVVERMTETLDRLGGDHRAQFEMLMRDKRASLCPMRLTAGYANAITEDGAIAVLDEMRRVVATPFVEQVRSDAESRIGEVRLKLQSSEKRTLID
ncbi:MAG: hypothetical protein IPP82_16825 [Xanthomonadales bacterium]|nr:hypothetical protein [Xanthomonadales bacterium]